MSLGLLKLFGDALNFAGMAISFCSNLIHSTEMSVFASQSNLAQPNIIPNKMYGACMWSPLWFLEQISLHAGPLLLNALLRHMKEARGRDDIGRDGHPIVVDGETLALLSWIPSPGSVAYGCCCVALLGLGAVLKVGGIRPPL